MMPPHLPVSRRQPALLGTVWLLLAGLLWPGPVVAIAVEPVVAVLMPKALPEYEVKAAYLVRFTRYIEWPAGTFADPSAPIVIGVLGLNPFGDALKKVADGAKSNGRPLQVRQLAEIPVAGQYHVIFIAQGQVRETEWINALRGRPVVTITESSDGLERGAVLAVYVEQGSSGPRVVFGASLPAARVAGLQLSAAMLPSARRLIREEADKKGGP